MVRVLAFTVALLVAATTVARADCLTTSQIVVGAAIATNGYTIMRYDAQGDPWYDQMVPWCGSHAAREAACNAVAITGIVMAENAVKRARPESIGRRNTMCLVNFLVGGSMFVYTRHAIGVQILGRRY